jgi:hypothetical protein
MADRRQKNLYFKSLKYSDEGWSREVEGVAKREAKLYNK